MRQRTQSALTRSEVSGGGRTPRSHKGTGHARQGSIRAPQWRHGGIVFAPKPRDYSYSVNKKVRRLAMKSAFSSKLFTSDIIVLDSFQMEEYKTKTVANVLSAIGVEKKALIVLPELEDKIIKSARNLKGIKTSQVNTLNVYDILNANKLVILKDAVAKIEEVYA
jgi:large subunit ribosomal protein L4